MSQVALVGACLHLLACREGPGNATGMSELDQTTDSNHEVKDLSRQFGNPSEITFEVRCPATVEITAETRFQFVTDGSIGSLMPSAERRQENYIEFTVSDLAFRGERRRAFIVAANGKSSQVFPLSVPTTPQARDWTIWRRPAYTETSDAAWTFMHDLKDHSRSTNVPANCFELRYRVAEAERQ